MNAQSKVVAELSPEYCRDGYGWALAQVNLLRERRFDEVDWCNVIEEIESVGRSERRAVESALFQVALHMLKWDAQPNRSGNSWWHSIYNGRDDAQAELEKNPSLKSLLDEMVADSVSKARRRAARETGLPPQVFDALDYSAAVLFERPFERPSRA